jgi:hypothetical protein
MILEWLTIDGTEYHDVEVAVYDLVPTEVFGQDADEHDTTATHVGFAKIAEDDIRLLSGTMQPSGTIAWDAA